MAAGCRSSRIPKDQVDARSGILPAYYRAEETLGGKAPPHKYVVAIKSTGGKDVGEEMTGPEWESSFADFENRTRDSVHVTAQRIIGRTIKATVRKRTFAIS